MLNRSEHPFLYLLLCYASGVATAYPGSLLLTQNILGYVIIFLFLGLLGLNFCYAKLRIYRIKGYTGCLLYLLTFITGAWHCTMKKELLQKEHFSKTAFKWLKVEIDNEPQLKKDFLRFQAKVIAGFEEKKWKACKGRLLISVKADSSLSSHFKYGKVLIINANHQPVPSPPEFVAFDVKSWLAMQNIYHSSYLKKEQIKFIGQNNGHPLLSYALDMRKDQISLLKNLIPDPQTCSVASTLLLGYRADISQETLNAYSRTGTIHALSVSGMHVALIYLILNWLSGILDRNSLLKLVKTLVIILVIWFYALITGFSPSVLRSSIMISVFILAKVFRKKTSNYNVLAFSALCILVWNPFLLFDIGLQLSYLSVFGLFWLQPMINNWFSFKPIWAAKLWSMIAVSLSAQLATFPLSIYYFHQFPVYFLFSNLFITLPVALIMYTGLLILIFKLFFLTGLFKWLIQFTNKGLEWISELPFASISSIWINKTELILISAAIITLVLCFKKKCKKLLCFSLCLLLGFTCSRSYNNIRTLQQQSVIILKLNKGYAGVYIKSKRAMILTNMTLQDGTFTFYIRPYLEQHGITEVHFKN